MKLTRMAKKGFGSVKFYPAQPDLWDTDLTEKEIKILISKWVACQQRL